MKCPIASVHVIVIVTDGSGKIWLGGFDRSDLCEQGAPKTNRAYKISLIELSITDRASTLMLSHGDVLAGRTNFEHT